MQVDAVTAHGHLLVEGHMAGRARERLQPSVDGQVLLQVVLMIHTAEHLATLGARRERNVASIPLGEAGGALPFPRLPVLHPAVLGDQVTPPGRVEVRLQQRGNLQDNSRSAGCLGAAVQA